MLSRELRFSPHYFPASTKFQRITLWVGRGKKRYFLLSNVTMLLSHSVTFLCNKRRIQGGHLEYLINNFPWNYSLGVEFTPFKEREKTTPTQSMSSSFRNRFQIPVAFRVFRSYIFYSPQKVRKITLSRVHDTCARENYRKWWSLFSNLSKSKDSNTNRRIKPASTNSIIFPWFALFSF